MSKPYPVEGECAFCGETFQHKVRPQGGGKVQKYCSTNCNKKSWAEGNPEKRKASVTKYDVRLENKAQKRSRAKAAVLKSKYNLTAAEVEQQFIRQNKRCYGCMTPLEFAQICIDHCHVTGRVRGILCNHCNWSLGHAKDNSQTLRRLQALLDYKRDKHNVYLIGSLRNRHIISLANEIRKHPEFDVMDEWITPGAEADTYWQEYEALRGRTWDEAMRSRGCQNIFTFDRAFMDHADTIVLTMPCGKSAMCELGYAAGMGKNTVIFMNGDKPDRYEVMPNFAQHIVHTQEELITLLKEIHNGPF